MSKRTIQIRAFIEVGTVIEGRIILRRLIRHAARRIIYEYQRRHYVFDFSDVIFVPQRHRDFLSNTKATAQADLNTVQVAATVSELLAVFDRIFA